MQYVQRVFHGNKSLHIEDIEFKIVDTLKWWIRVYFNDDMVDISYNKVENKIKNSLNY